MQIFDPETYYEETKLSDWIYQIFDFIYILFKEENKN